MTRSSTALIVTLAAVALVLPGCSDSGDDASCPPGLEPFVAFNFYFGLEQGDGSAVSDAEWQAFLAETVTPRFPDGLTVFDARGQWLDSDNDRLYREGTKVLNILVPAESAANAKLALDEVVNVYVEQFDQQSVFQTSTPACAGF